MDSLTHVAAALSLVTLLSACGTVREASCSATMDAATARARPSAGHANEAPLRLRLLQQEIESKAISDTLAERVAGKPAGTPLRLLALSTGGDWGAFGAGVLAGMRDADPAALDFDVVTGSSAGATLAPFAFLGRQQDMDALRKAYHDRGSDTFLTAERIYRKRNLLEYFWSDSLYDTTRLHDLLDRILTSDLIVAVAHESQFNKRVLAVTAVNIDTGAPVIFNLGRIAEKAGPDPTKAAFAANRELFIRAIMAAAAIPIAFNPVMIAGCMYVDGGVRNHLFLTSEVVAATNNGVKIDVDERGRRIALVDPKSGLKRPVMLRIIINGDRFVLPADTKDNMADMALRVFGIIDDEGLQANLDRLLAQGRLLGWNLKYIDAYDLTYNQSPQDPRGADQAGRTRIPGDTQDLFNGAFMSSLYDLARTRAAKDVGWVTDNPAAMTAPPPNRTALRTPAMTVAPRPPRGETGVASE